MLYHDLIRKPVVERLRSGVRRNDLLWRTVWKYYLRNEWMSLKLHLTHECNLYCRHCYGRSSDNIFIEKEKVIDILNRMSFKKKIRLDLMGGEPMLYEDIYDVVSHASKLAYIRRIQLYTNATGINGSSADRLKKNGVDTAIVPLGSIDSDIHDSSTGSVLSWNRTVDGVKSLVSAGISTYLIVVVGSTNYRELSDVDEFAASLGAGTVYFPYIPQPGEEGLAVEDAGEYRKCINWMFNKSRSYREKSIEYMREYGRLCNAFPRSLSIMADGSVKPCPFVDMSMGNIFRDDIKILLQESYADKEYVDFIKLPAYCEACSLDRMCGGGCKAILYNRSKGNISAKEHICPGPYSGSISDEDLGLYLPHFE